MDFVECPLCGRRPRCGWVGLVRHVVKCHQDILTRYAKTTRARIGQPDERNSYYWCRVCKPLVLYGPNGNAMITELDVKEHWDNHGGLASHILVEGLK